MRMYTVLHSHALKRFGIVPHSATSLNQDTLVAVVDNKAVKTSFNAIELVARLVFRPKGFGNDAEHGAAVPPIRARTNARNPAIANIQNGSQLITG